MYMSKFVLPLKLHTNHVVLFSTLSKAVVKVDGETYRAIESRSWDDISLDSVDCLEKMGLVVKSLKNESIAFVNAATNKSKNADNHFNLHLLATTACNFRCSYCFQNGIEHQALKTDDIDAMLDPIEKYLCEQKIQTLSLVLYGGEPTLNWNFTMEFIANLTSRLGAHNIKYDTQIITNGYALSDEKLSFLSLHNCKKIQITLDGCRDMHDSRRRHNDGKPTFDKIIENIRTALNKNYIKKVSIRLNYDKENIDSQIELLDYLAQEFDVSRIHIALGCVTSDHAQQAGDEGNELSSTVYTHDDILENDNHVRAYISLYIHAKRLGFSMRKFYTINGICIAKRNHSVLLCSDGNYYKCGGLVGRINHSVGEVGNELVPYSYHKSALYDECFSKECEMMPLCHAGCRLDAFYRTGALDGRDCKYNLVKNINLELLKINYDDATDLDSKRL